MKYKVVSYQDGKLLSSFTTEWGTTLYKIGEWVQAPRPFIDYGYYLFVFNNLQDAVIYANQMDLNYIYECEVKGRHKIVKLPDLIDVDYTSYSKIIIQLKIRSKISYHIARKFYPDGTELWEYVKLVRRVEWR